MTENRNLLAIPLDVPEPAPVPHRRSALGPKPKPLASPGGRAPDQEQGHARRQPSQGMSFPEMFARGLLERGESLGINKTLMSAVSELRV